MKKLIALFVILSVAIAANGRPQNEELTAPSPSTDATETYASTSDVNKEATRSNAEVLETSTSETSPSTTEDATSSTSATAEYTSPAATTTGDTTPSTTEYPYSSSTTTEYSSPSTTEDPIPSIPEDTVPSTTTEPSIASLNPLNPSKLIDKFSDQVRKILKHFQEPGALGLPDQTVLPDPMAVPNMTQSLGLASGNFYNLTVHELSKFEIQQVDTDLDDMRVHVALYMNRLIVLGNYTVSTLLTGSYEGPFNMTMINVTAEGTVDLIIDTDGKLLATDAISNMDYKEMQLNLSTNNSFVENVLTTAVPIVFGQIKPFILRQVDEKIERDVNDRLKKMSPRIPNAPSSPVDLAILEGRKYVKKLGFDPYTIENIFTVDQEYLTIKLEEITVYGLSRFSRVGNVSLSMKNGSLYMGLQLITGKLHGTCKWFYDFGKVGITRLGVSNFSIDHVQILANVIQPIDIRKKPVLDTLEIETGKVLVKMDGKGSFDYIIELAVGLLPKMIRYVIIDALENPIKVRVQQILNHIDVESIVEESLPKLDTYINNNV